MTPVVAGGHAGCSMARWTWQPELDGGHGWDRRRLQTAMAAGSERGCELRRRRDGRGARRPRRRKRLGVEQGNKNRRSMEMLWLAKDRDEAKKRQRIEEEDGIPRKKKRRKTVRRDKVGQQPANGATGRKRSRSTGKKRFPLFYH